MKANRVSMLCVRSGVLAAGTWAAVSAAVSCTEKPPMDCTVGRGAFAVKFIRPGGDQVGPCGLGNGDVFGAQAYMGSGAAVAGFPGSLEPDLTKASAAIQSHELGLEYFARDGVVEMAGHPYAYGPFQAPRPDGGNFCHLPAAEAHLTAPWVPPVPDDPATPDDDSVPGVAPLDKSYAWSNVRFYVTPGIQGLQFDGTLTYTDNQMNANPADGTGGTVCQDPNIKAVGLFYPGFANYTMPSSSGQGCVIENYTSVPDPMDPKAMVDYLTSVTVDQAACDNIKVSGVATDFPSVCIPLTAPQYQAPLYTCAGTTCTDTGTTTSVNGYCFVRDAETRSIPILK